MRPDRPSTFSIHRLQEGKNHHTRSVLVTQEDTDGPCFSGTVAFKRPEPSALNYQPPTDIFQKYASVLEGKTPSDFPQSDLNVA